VEIKSVTIIGAGISGISAAIYAQKKGYRVKVIEASASCGGIIDTFSKDNIFFEFGAHSLYNSYVNLLELIKEAKLEHLLVQKKKLPFLMYENGRTYTVLKKLKKIRLSFGIIAWYLFPRKKYSISQYYIKIMGCYNYKHILRHCFNAVLSQDARDFPASLLFKIKQRNKSFPRQYAIQGGLRALVEQLVSYYKIEVDLNCSVISLKESYVGGYIIETNQGDFKSDKIILATPVKNAVSLLASINLTASNILNQINVSKIVSCGVIFRSDCSKLPRVAGLIGVDESFYSLVSSDPYNNTDDSRAVVIHFKYDQASDESYYKNQAYKILGISEVDVIVFRFKNQSVPMLHQKHGEKIKLLDDCLSENNVQITGNYFKRLAIEDCITRSKLAISLL
jgi:oxygen-dependent protoporphyrinogen oxidase